LVMGTDKSPVIATVSIFSISSLSVIINYSA
jgi:hypothetical protein